MTVVNRSKPLWDDPHGTSGSVATTVMDTIKVIEHATRRAGGIPATLTPEQLETASDNLYLILTSIANRGINLWCLDKQVLALAPGKKHYALPVGTVNVQNVAYRTSQLLAATAVRAPASYTLTATGTIRSVGVVFDFDYQMSAVLEYMSDTQPWKAVRTVNQFVRAGTVQWFDLDPSLAITAFRFRDPANAALPVREAFLATGHRELPLSPINRDDYAALPDKNSAGTPTSYLFERQVQPILTLWQVPTSDRDALVVRRQRQVQDVGGMLDKIEVPERWFDCIIWMLAKNLAYELPALPAERIAMCEKNADAALREAELEEGDGMPLSITPNISGYTS
jgi:hypothetical protein